MGKELIKTFTEVDPRKLLSVTPYGFLGMADEYRSHMQDSMGSSSQMGASMYSALGNGSSSDSFSGSDKLSIAALAMSIVAIAAVLASFFAKSHQASSPPSHNDGALAVTSTKKMDDPSLAVPPSVA